MNQDERPLERRFYTTLEARDSSAEHYVAIARGFKDVAEFRAYRAARETRADVGDYERRLTVLELEDR